MVGECSPRHRKVAVERREGSMKERREREKEREINECVLQACSLCTIKE
jgi:hypothetical protein